VALLALALALPLAAPSAHAADCAAWAGEFDPLPTVGDPDPLRARWARMRADQLVALATRAEPRDRADALRLWQRVQCLEPDSAAALAGIERMRSDRVSEAPAPPPPEPAPVVREKRKPRVERKPAKRKPVEVEPAPAAVAARAPEAPKPVETKPPEPKVVEAKPPEPPSVATPLARTEKLIREARFDDALGAIEKLRPDAVRPDERARLEVLAATAQVAFGDDAAARSSIERALRADPALALDESTTSPKLLRVLDDARAVIAAPPYAPAASELKPVAEGPP
jgi:hypothetical protein